MISLLNKLGRRRVSDRGEKLNNPRLFSCTAKRVLSVLFLLILGFSFLPHFDIDVSAATKILEYNFFVDEQNRHHVTVTVQVQNPGTVDKAVSFWGPIFTITDSSQPHNGAYGYANLVSTSWTWTDSTAKAVGIWEGIYYPEYVGTQTIKFNGYDYTVSPYKAISASTTITATEEHLTPLSIARTPNANFIYEVSPRDKQIYWRLWTGSCFGRPLTNYTIYWRPKGTEEWSSKVVATQMVGAINGYISGLTNGTTYEWKATSTNEVGTSTSSIYTATPGTPTPPLNVTAFPVDGGVKWTWDAPADLRGGKLQGYRIYYGNQALTLVSNTGLVNSYTRTGYTNGNSSSSHITSVRVAAIVEYGVGEMSASASNVWVGSPQPVANACCIMLNS